MKFLFRALARFPAWMACLCFGAVSCGRPGHLGDWLERPDRLPSGEAAALHEWIAANGFDSAAFPVAEGLESVRGPRGVQIREGRIYLLRAEAATSLEGLAGLTGLHTLELYRSDLASLEGCPPSLVFLTVGESELRSLEGIGACTKLVSLRLDQTAVSDLAPLQACPSLTELTATGHTWENIALPPLPALTRLDLGRNELAEVAGLERLSGLRTLILRDNRLAGLRGIGTLTSLESVDLSGNRIADATRIAVNTSAKRLDVKRNPIADFAPLQAWSGLEKFLAEPKPDQALPASLAEIAGSGAKPSGPGGQEQVARELMEKYLKGAAFVEEAPSGSGRGERVRSKIASRFSSGGAADISGTVGVDRLEGRFRLRLAQTDNVLYYGREVSVSGEVSVAAGRLEIYSPVDMDFWQQAALFVDNPVRRGPAPEGLQLKGYLVTEVTPGEAHPFQANLLALAGDFALLLHAPDGEASGIEITLE